MKRALDEETRQRQELQLELDAANRRTMVMEQSLRACEAERNAASARLADLERVIDAEFNESRVHLNDQLLRLDHVLASQVTPQPFPQ